MAGEQYFYQPPNYLVNNCCTTAPAQPGTPPTPPPPLTPAQTTAVQQMLSLMGYARVGEIVAARGAGAGNTDVFGYLDDISQDGKTVTIADVETGAKTTMARTFLNYYTPEVNNYYYPPQTNYYQGTQNYYGNPNVSNYYFGRSAHYQTQRRATTHAIQVLMATSTR